MHCAYINLDSQTARRAAFEANFAQYKGPDWKLTRIAAVDRAYVAREVSCMAEDGRLVAVLGLQGPDRFDEKARQLAAEPLTRAAALLAATA